MDNCQLEDLLEERSRRFRQSDAQTDLTANLPENALVLVPLLLLAREIATLLVPIKPRSKFRQQLHHDLVGEARRQRAMDLLSIPYPTPLAPAAETDRLRRMRDWISQETSSLPSDRRWVLGAAAVGSAVSLVGILAYVLRHRGRPAASA
jgi:hypothetical protein